MGKKSKVYKTDMDLIDKKLGEIGSGKFWKPKEGKNVIRILPPWNDEGLFYLEATLHYGFESEGKKKAYPCLGRGKCPICQYASQLSEGSSEDMKLAKRIQAKTKYYANIFDRKTEKVSIWGFSRKTLGSILGFMADKEDGADITDPEEGHDVIVMRTGTGFNDTKYEIRIRPRDSEVEDYEEGMFNLSEEVLEEASARDLKDAIKESFGESSDDDDDDDDDKPKKKKKHRDDDDDDDDNGDDDDDDDDKPKKKKKHRDDDDDDDDDDNKEDDDDEDEKEARRRKKKKKREKREKSKKRKKGKGKKRR